MYKHLGDKDEQDAIRNQNVDKMHCAWLRRKADACISLPEGVSGAEPCSVCPHNVYEQHPEVFDARDDVAETVIRLFRLTSSAELHILNETDIDAVTATELFSARSELDRLSREKQEKQQAQQRAAQQAQQDKALADKDVPQTMGSE